MQIISMYLFLILLLLGDSKGVPVSSSSWSGWSSCSHTCNGGVRSQECLSGNCSGEAATQYTSCNTQDCPVHMADVRDRQCTKVGNEFYSQYSHLTWKAKRDGRAGELCELFCVLEDPAIQINTPIDNGTPCIRDDGSKGRCLGKLCAAIGCDGILGSTRQHDKCHRCLGYPTGIVDNSKACIQFGNALNTNTNQNQVISFIPINSMSVTIKYSHHFDLLSLSESQHFPANISGCSLDGNIFTVQDDGSIFAAGPLTQSITVSLSTSSDGISTSVTYEYHLLVQEDQTTDVISTNKTYSWSHGPFNPCSVTCGGGVQVSHVYCRDTGYPNKIMPDKFCWNSNKPFPLVQKCSKGDCPARWVAGDWGICSTKCGDGMEYRTVKCWRKSHDGSDYLTQDSDCSGLVKPITSRKCNVKPCGTTWKISDWSICSRRCGLGTQNRTVQCLDNLLNVVDDLYCLEDTRDKPVTIRPCDEGPCYSSWYTSEWSKCSKSCGEGHKTRTVYCSDQNAIPVSDSKCINVTKPSSQQACREVRGCFAVWISSKWSSCQGSCDDETAYQRRSVDCYVLVEENEFEVIQEMCDNATKPLMLRKCPDDQCAKWKTDEWGECSKDCGPGEKQRNVVCMKGKNLSNECDISKKPPHTAPCEIQPCTDCVDNPAMDCSKMIGWCHIDFVKMNCCKTCS